MPDPTKRPLMIPTTSERGQLWSTGMGLVFLITVSLLAQSQDAINARVDERMLGLVQRMDKLETLVWGMIVAVAANLVAHILNLREQAVRRNLERYGTSQRS